MQTALTITGVSLLVLLTLWLQSSRAYWKEVAAGRQKIIEMMKEFRDAMASDVLASAAKWKAGKEELQRQLQLDKEST